MLKMADNSSSDGDDATPLLKFVLEMADNSSSDGNDVTSTAPMVCFTGSKSKMFAGVTISWSIEDMEEKMQTFPPGKQLRTDSFNINGRKLSCYLWPNGSKEEYKGNISFALFSESKERFTANCECSVGKGDSRYVRSYKQEFNSGHFDWGWPRFLPHKKVKKKRKKLMSRGIMEFTIVISLDEESTPSPQVKPMEDISEINLLRNLSENFSKILLDENSSDFLIICGEDKFPVHRNVLKARSSFFDGVQSSTSEIVIENMDSDTVKRLIEFIYTGKIKDLESNPTQLLKAANMYDLNLLRKSCEDKLISSMNLENVVDLFVLAEDQNAVELRAVAKKMILEKRADIVKQEGWHTKLGTHMIELFESL